MAKEHAERKHSGGTEVTYRGHVENGVVVLDEPAPLADGVEVRVEPVQQPDRFQSLREGLMRLAGTVKDMPADMARNHDHYIHGTRRR